MEPLYELRSILTKRPISPANPLRPVATARKEEKDWLTAKQKGFAILTLPSLTMDVSNQTTRFTTVDPRALKRKGCFSST